VNGDAFEAKRIGAPPPKASSPSTVNTKSLTDYQKSIVERAASEGRQLRQDEKAKVNGPALLLAQSWEDHEDLDPTGWHYSEKLDGVRGYWNGKDFLSRQGNIFHAPTFFKEGLPSVALDGELWMARQAFQSTLSVVRTDPRGNPGLEARWRDVTYLVFDMPDHGGVFEARLTALRDLKSGNRIPFLRVHEHGRVKSRAHVLSELKRHVKEGAEGLMLRQPGSLYERRRSPTLLKVKDFKDAEAVVVGHEAGKGRHKGRLGALLVRMPNGKTFNIGTGFSDAERRNPPKSGSTITYRYTEHTTDGIPKCASFLCVRDYE
jgi:DNA ligase-1